MNTGDNLRAWMATRNMTQRQLADALGMSEATVSLFVNNVRRTSGGFRWRFANRYGFDVAQGLFGDDRKETPL